MSVTTAMEGVERTARALVLACLDAVREAHFDAQVRAQAFELAQAETTANGADASGHGEVGVSYKIERRGKPRAWREVSVLGNTVVVESDSHRDAAAVAIGHLFEQSGGAEITVRKRDCSGCGSATFRADTPRLTVDGDDVHLIVRLTQKIEGE